MRGGLRGVAALLLCLGAACGKPDPVPPPPDPVPPPADPGEDPVPVYRFPAVDLREGAGAGGVVPVRAEPPSRPPDPADEVLRLQKEAAERNPDRDDEKLRLALLLAAAGKTEEAEKALAGVRARTNRLVPWLECFLRRERGDHGEAGRLLEGFLEEDRRAAGFVLERVERCTRILRYREFVPAGNDPVKAGGKVLLYVEPRNFTLAREGDKHVLHLRYDWRLYDGRSVERPVPAWQKAPPEVREDRIALSGPAREFYQSFTLPLPEDLEAGSYRIQVTVEDVATGRRAGGDVSLEVAARGRDR